MKKQIEVVVPKNWSAVTLRDYLELNEDLKSYSDNEEAMTAVLFHKLCKLKVEWISKLDIVTYSKIKQDLNQFLSNTELPLKKWITINGKVFGFEPNLSNMSYGAYVDISNYNELTINDKWAEIMAILYRPVTLKTGELYDIEEYTGNGNPALFLDIGMDVHFGALFFLQTLLQDLLKGIQNYLMEMEELPHNISTILRRNGNLIHH